MREITGWCTVAYHVQHARDQFFKHFSVEEIRLKSYTPRPLVSHLAIHHGQVTFVRHSPLPPPPLDMVSRRGAERDGCAMILVHGSTMVVLFVCLFVSRTESSMDASRYFRRTLQTASCSRQSC